MCLRNVWARFRAWLDSWGRTKNPNWMPPGAQICVSPNPVSENFENPFDKVPMRKARNINPSLGLDFHVNGGQTISPEDIEGIADVIFDEVSARAKRLSGYKPKISRKQRVAIDHRFIQASERLDELWAGMLSYAPPEGISKKAMNRVCQGVTDEALERLKCQVLEIIENG